MKTSNLLIILFMLTCISFACEAKTVKESRNISGTFHKVSTSSGIGVVYTQGSTVSVEVEAEETIIKEIETTVKNETLVIKFKENNRSFRNTGPLTVKVTGPALEEVNISGGASFTAESLDGKSFNLNTSGGAKGNISNLKSSGTIDINASGGASCAIAKAEAANGEFNSSGGARIEIHLDKSAKVSANASGGARIRLSGSAESVDVNASGGGRVNIRELNSQKVNSNSSGGGGIDK